VSELCREIQQAYWTFDAEEKAKLLKGYPDGLSWCERLRLLHLACLELLNTEQGQKQLGAGEMERAFNAPEGETRDLCEALVEQLMREDSPYRPRYVLVWQGSSGQSNTREPDIRGPFRNASITHLGALEVVRLDEKERPRELAFVGLDELRGVAFGRPAVFRAAKLFYDDDRGEEIVLSPLLYGVSWDTPNAYYRDGSMTRFCCHIEIEGLPSRVAVGVGHQDYAVMGANGGASLLGLGSVGELVVALSPDDPKLEQKCKARGMDPDQVTSGPDP